MFYDNKVTLAGFLQSLCYTRPEEHVEIELHSYDGTEESFKPVPCDVYTVSKYANYPISNIAIENDNTFSVMVEVDAD